MRNPYNSALPIETLFHQIEVAVEFTEAGNRPYEKSQIISRAYLLIFRTGLYQEVCRDWDEKLDPNKTWVIFKTFFTTAYRDSRLMQTAAKQTGFHTNNSSSMQLHANKEENDDNNINAVINELVKPATKDKENMTATFTDLTPIQSRNFKTRSKKWMRKVEIEKGITIMRVIARLMTELGTITTQVITVLTRKTDIKVTPLSTSERTAPINGAIMNDA